MREKKFQDEIDLKQYLEDFFKLKSTEFFAKCIRDLPLRWQDVVPIISDKAGVMQGNGGIGSSMNTPINKKKEINIIK